MWVSWDTTIVRIEHWRQGGCCASGRDGSGIFLAGAREPSHIYRVLEKGKTSLGNLGGASQSPWGDAGDTNGDGVRHTYQDEFVEVANQGKHPIDIGGHFLGDDDAPVEKPLPISRQHCDRYANGRRALWRWRCDCFRARFVDDGRIGDGLSNWSDTVQLLAPDSSTVVASMGYERSTRGVSFARNEDGNYLLHNEIYKEDSTSVGRLRPGDDPITTNPVEPYSTDDPRWYRVFRILMLPEQVDANNDGVVDRDEDTFVELTNIGADTLNLSGCYSANDDIVVSQFFPFPDHVVLLPGGYITIFGGGTPVGIPGTVLSAEGQIGNGLSSSGDVVHLIMPDARLWRNLCLVPKPRQTFQWLFSPDDPPELHPKIPSGHAMSPGTSPGWTWGGYRRYSGPRYSRHIPTA